VVDRCRSISDENEPSRPPPFAFMHQTSRQVATLTDVHPACSGLLYSVKLPIRSRGDINCHCPGAITGPVCARWRTAATRFGANFVRPGQRPHRA